MSKIQLTIAIKFISSKDNDEKHTTHSKSGNIELRVNDKVDKVIEKRFESLLNKYQIRLKTTMSGSHFIFHCFHLLYYKFHKTNFKRGES